MWLPSRAPSGNPVADRVWFTYYPARAGAPPYPAVVLLHALGDPNAGVMHRFARFLAARGIASAVVTLPWHGRRLPRGDSALAHYVPLDAARAEQAYMQAASDTSTVADWLRRQPEVDSTKVGVVGVSLGAIIAHLAMGLEPSLDVGVAILGGGDLPDLYRRSALFRALHPHLPPALTPEQAALLRAIDPLTYADRNHPRRVLMIQAARDMVIPPSDATKLWEALGRPPIRWIDTNHFGIMLAVRPLMVAATEFLKAAWSAPPRATIRPPAVWAPTLKLGTLFGLDSLATPALQWQALTLGVRRDHMALFHFDLGLSGRGPFAALGVTLNPFMDAGLAERTAGRAPRPYLSVHVVF